jgi:chitosanase
MGSISRFIRDFLVALLLGFSAVWTVYANSNDGPTLAVPCPLDMQGITVDPSLQELRTHVVENPDPEALLTRAQRKKIETISTLFENSEMDFQYAYIEDIGDGQGITAGRIGYTSQAGDLAEVVKLYVAAKGKNTPLARYIPCLESLKGENYACLFPQKNTHSKYFKTKGLMNSDFGKAWVEAAADPVMRKAQDHLVEKNVYKPTFERARKLGIKSAFGIAVLFDTILQEGSDDTPNTIGGIIRRAQKTFESRHPGMKDPADGADEAEWLKTFLIERRATLKRPYQEDGKPGLQDNAYVSYPRADTMLEMLSENNPDLSKPIHIKYFGDRFVIP